MKLLYHLQQVLGSCGFQRWGFQMCTFSKNRLIIQLMQFSLHKWRNSFTHAFLVINDISAVRIWLLRIFARPKKMHGPGPSLAGLKLLEDFFFLLNTHCESTNILKTNPHGSWTTHTGWRLHPIWFKFWIWHYYQQKLD